MEMNTTEIGGIRVTALKFETDKTIEHHVSFDWNGFTFIANVERDFEGMYDAFTAMKHVKQFFEGCRSEYDDDIMLLKGFDDHIVIIKPEYVLVLAEDTND